MLKSDSFPLRFYSFPAFRFFSSGSVLSQPRCEQSGGEPAERQRHASPDVSPSGITAVHRIDPRLVRVWRGVGEVNVWYAGWGVAAAAAFLAAAVIVV